MKDIEHRASDLMRAHIAGIRDRAVKAAQHRDSQGATALIRELGELALCLEASARTNADACRVLGKELRGRRNDGI